MRRLAMIIGAIAAVSTVAAYCATVAAVESIPVDQCTWQAAIREGGAQTVLALVLYLVVLRMVPAFLEAMKVSSAGNDAAIKELADRIAQNTQAVGQVAVEVRGWTVRGGPAPRNGAGPN